MSVLLLTQSCSKSLLALLSIFFNQDIGIDVCFILWSDNCSQGLVSILESNCVRCESSKSPSHNMVLTASVYERQVSTLKEECSCVIHTAIACIQGIDTLLPGKAQTHQLTDLLLHIRFASLCWSADTCPYSIVIHKAALKQIPLLRITSSMLPFYW